MLRDDLPQQARSIYISGPISGLPNGNREVFAAAAQHLRSHGFHVVNPHEVNPQGGTWEECMRRDIAAMMACDTVALLPGWSNSRGAQVELAIAEALGMRIVGREVA